LNLIVTIEDDEKKEKLMDQHHKVGKDFKKDLQKREKDLEELELKLIVNSQINK
jgi:hypothetical protein